MFTNAMSSGAGAGAAPKQASSETLLLMANRRIAPLKERQDVVAESEVIALGKEALGLGKMSLP